MDKQRNNEIGEILDRIDDLDPTVFPKLVASLSAEERGETLQKILQTPVTDLSPTSRALVEVLKSASSSPSAQHDSNPSQDRNQMVSALMTQHKAAQSDAYRRATAQAGIKAQIHPSDIDFSK